MRVRIQPLVSLLFVLLSGIGISSEFIFKSASPKLVVVLVVDQMRADYIDQFYQQWNKGLHRLINEGAWFRQAAFPYLHTVTCGGHATISTGSFPMHHGVFQNTWWDREQSKIITCTEDSSERTISYGMPLSGGESFRRLNLPTLADELRSQIKSRSKIVTLSLKARAAIMLAGRQADVVTWFDNDGSWATSTAYTQTPVPFIREFTTANPVEHDLHKSWTRTLPKSHYLYSDLGIGERPQAGWKTVFPHPLQTQTGNIPNTPDVTFYSRWQRSPFSDDYLGKMASSAIETLALGQGPGTDFLGISFSALDLAGHDFGPHSHEVQDVLIRLDATIGKLLADFDRMLGPDNYVVALSADHGVSPIPARSKELKFDAGQISPRQIELSVEETLLEILGPGPHVARIHGTDLYFRKNIFKKLLENPDAMQATIDAIQAVPGVWYVLRSDHLGKHSSTSDSIVKAAGLSYYSGRSGDLIIIPKPYWLSTSTTLATTHGSVHAYDRRVPLILFGNGIKSGKYLQPATPADIAPTLAFLSGITLAQSDGRILREALIGK